MQSEELKPCPFCGGKNLSFRLSDIEGWIAHVECTDCDDMLGPMSEWKHDDKEDAEKDAAAVWNRRPCLEAALSAAEPQPAPSVAVKALADAYKAGFDASSQGYNGEVFPEYEADNEWLAQRDSDLSALSAQVQEVAGWQRITIETGRKSGTSHADVWPDGEGWEIDTDRGRVNTPDAGWDRFSHHEELYFRRRANDLPAAPAKQEGCESKPVHKPTVDSGESGDE
jgi:Lar family restriction alleviation protein